jgi:hypothetical protein
MGGGVRVCSQLDDVGVAEEAFLHADLLVDHLLNDRVAAVIPDDLESPPSAALLLDYEDVPHRALADLPADDEACPLDDDLLL